MSLIVVVAASVDEHVAADGSHISQLRRRNGLRGVSQRGKMFCDQTVIRNGGQAFARADPETVFALANSL